MKTRQTFIIALLIVAVTLALVAPTLQVCRDWAFIDLNTGSRKGHREWFFRWRTGNWYRESALESFMRSKHPEELKQNWVSYAGTGRNVFGRAILAGHGQPGPIIFLKPDFFDNYTSDSSQAEKLQLYEVLSSEDHEKIQDLIDVIFE